jgi:phosphomannomutase
MSRHVVLFDMDGTLTEPRKPFASILSSPLKQLVQVADIGIVTGSDLPLLQEQMETVLNDNSIRYSLHILPCNGTQYLKPPEFPSDFHIPVESVSMQEKMGNVAWRRLMEIIITHQLRAAELDIPLTGQFINNRKSMINWCPSGRAANDTERKKFENYDRKYSFRRRVLNELRSELTSATIDNVTVKLGGETSFDIYPTGWDKTYSLRYFKDSTVWFVGDRAQTPKGNDYEIYKACEPRSYHTTGPEKTVDIIKEIIERIEKEK